MNTDKEIDKFIKSGDNDMSEKTNYIRAYFDMWDKRLARTSKLIKQKEFYYEGVLVFLCYIGAFAADRYPILKDGEAYKKILLEYSGMKHFYEQINILFLYQFPRSKFREHGDYKELKNYSKIVDALKTVYGDEEDISEDCRYVSPSELMKIIKDSGIPYFDENNFWQKIILFSRAEILYRYVRCGAVHHGYFPFVSEPRNIETDENSSFDGNLIMETTFNIKYKIMKECIDADKFPNEL